MGEQKDIREQLSAYLDGELTAQQARRVEEALAGDPALAAELAALRATRDLLRKLPSQQAGEDFTTSVLDRAERMRLLGQLHPGSPKRTISWSTLATAAAVLIAAGAGIFVTVKLVSMESFQDGLAHNKSIQVAKAPPQEPAKGIADQGKAPVPADAPPREVLSARDNLETARLENKTQEQQAEGRPGAAQAANEPNLANANNVVIYTDNLPEARHQVENLLASNAIVQRAAPAAGASSGGMAAMTNGAYQPAEPSLPNAPQAQQVQIVAMVPSRQMEQLQNDLRAMRGNQAATDNSQAVRQFRYSIASPVRSEQPAPEMDLAAGTVQKPPHLPAATLTAKGEAQIALAAPAEEKVKDLATKPGIKAKDKNPATEPGKKALTQPTSQGGEELQPLVITVSLATPTSAPTSVPSSTPASAPAASTAPASQPASLPATEPVSQPASDPAEIPPADGKTE